MKPEAVGLDLRSVFEKGFAELAEPWQTAKLGSLSLMTISLGLLISPAAYHRIAERGADSARLHAFITRVTGLALLPFAVALGIDVAVSMGRVFAPRAAFAGGASACLVALLLWYGLEEVQRRRMGKRGGSSMREKTESRSQPTGLDERIRNVLTETRVALPGAQALLGFQFLAVLTDRFQDLPEMGKTIHFASLAAIAVTTILLMSPAAWHRIVEEGENSERFHRVASVFLLTALVTLALGMAGDLFVVVLRVTQKESLAAASAVVSLLFFYGLWFGYTSVRRISKVSRSRVS